MRHRTLGAWFLVGLSAWLTSPAYGAEAPEADDGGVPSVELVAIGRFTDPDLEYDGDGHRHVVATTVTSGTDDGGDLWYATDRSGGWVARELLAGHGCERSWTQPSLAVDGDGSVHVAVVDGRPCDAPNVPGGIFYLTDRGRAPGDFGPHTRVAPRQMGDPQLVVSDGVRYLAYWRFGLPGQRSQPLFLRTDRSGQWQTQRMADPARDPALAVDGAGRVHLVYRDVVASGDGQLRYTRARRSDSGFTRPRAIPRTRSGFEPSLAVDATGRPEVTWVGQQRPLVAWSTLTDGDWSPPQRPGRGVEHFLGIDDAGRSHLIFQRAPQGQRQVVHSVREGETWVEELLALGDARAGLDGAIHDSDISAVWAPIAGFGLWASAAGVGSDPADLAIVEALDGLVGSLSWGLDCSSFDEHGANDPFEYGAIAAIQCDRPLGGVRQLALFRFPHGTAMDEYWTWRLGQIRPAPPLRTDACRDGEPGRGSWTHGRVVCYISSVSGEAKMRFTDERTATYGVVDGQGQDLGRLWNRWQELRPSQ